MRHTASRRNVDIIGGVEEIVNPLFLHEEMIDNII
jgi:hypothetical protein